MGWRKRRSWGGLVRVSECVRERGSMFFVLSCISSLLRVDVEFHFEAEPSLHLVSS